MHNELYRSTIREIRDTNYDEPHLVVLTQEHNCYIVWETGPADLIEKGRKFVAFVASRDDAIEYAVDYGRRLKDQITAGAHYGRLCGMRGHVDDCNCQGVGGDR